VATNPKWPGCRSFPPYRPTFLKTGLLTPFIRTKLNEKGEIADAATKTAVQPVLQALIKTIEVAAALRLINVNKF
jgi:hypothetical protein